ncbi:MAG TPA: acetyl-CoA carboxylase biotin carboxyl carrier protein [Phycisphaerae bacterium]|jgi:acetyl-CoA carboxylase biotin carboxyl carrier protein
MAKKTAQSGSPQVGFTDTKRVKELVALMAENGLTEIELVEDKSKIVLRRGGGGGGGGGVGMMPQMHHHVAPVAPMPQAPTAATAAPKAEEELLTIRSIMVGTFYSAPSPDAGPFVSVGSHVDEKTTVCIIEAMKVFNPIAAEVRGEIVKVLVSNGQVVEFDQPLFMVRPE